MYRSALVAAICLGLPIQAAWSEDAIPLTNVTINMINRGGRGGYRIEAKIANPNDFAIFDLHVNCEIKDRRGNNLTIYAATISDAIQARKPEPFDV